MILVLGHQHLGEKSRGGDALVDDMGRYRCLDQRFTLTTNPLAADVALDAEGAGV